ncbi:oligosaccharide flippase family protein [Streptomyces sp. NPDC048324]|uniref:lipopolysaccharide biosynthesis protein n=1 Tax=Streptomyces sp. NPDC048324 TaxID=3157205 RepID=UPI003441D20D
MSSPGARPEPSSGHRLLPNLGFSALAQAAPQITNLVLTPYLVHHLGLDRFGVWSLILVFLATLTVLDGGIGASLGRFHAYHAARADRAGTGRLVIGSLVAFVALGVLVAVLAMLLSATLVSVLDVPLRLRGDVRRLLTVLAPLLTLALTANSVSALLQANERFRALAGVSVGSCALYAVAVTVLVDQGGDLLLLALLTAGRYLLVTLVGLGAAAGHLRIQRPLLPLRAERHEFGAYAMRMQLSGFTVFLNGEIDALVVAALLPVRYVGIYAAGYQAAMGLRSLPLYAFPPILTRMTQVFTVRGLAGAAREFRTVQARWVPAVSAYSVVVTGWVGLAVPIWLGPGLGLSGAVAVVLMAGYSVQVALTGVRTCFVRATGRPGYETRYSWCSTVVNLLLTVPLALAFGVVGVVLGTAIGITAGSLYFVILCRRLAGLRDARLPSRWFPATLLAVAIAVLGTLPVLWLGWHGVLPLLLAGVPVLGGLAAAGFLLLPGLVAGPVSEKEFP